MQHSLKHKMLRTILYSVVNEQIHLPSEPTQGSSTVHTRL